MALSLTAILAACEEYALIYGRSFRISIPLASRTDMSIMIDCGKDMECFPEPSTAKKDIDRAG